MASEKLLIIIIIVIIVVIIIIAIAINIFVFKNATQFCFIPVDFGQNHGNKAYLPLASHTMLALLFFFRDTWCLEALCAAGPL